MRSTTSGHSVRTLGRMPAISRSADSTFGGWTKLPTKSSSPASPAAFSAREGTETPSGMISMGVVPASGLSVAASRSVSATTACTMDMTPRSNRSQARSSSPAERRASPGAVRRPVPRRSRAGLVLSQHPRRGAARERGEIGAHYVILQLHDVGMPQSRDLSNRTRELGTERPSDRSGRPPCQPAGNPEPPSEAAHGAGGRTSGDLPDEVAALQQPRVGGPIPEAPEVDQCHPVALCQPYHEFGGGTAAAVSAVATWGKRGEEQQPQASSHYSDVRKNRVLLSELDDGRVAGRRAADRAARPAGRRIPPPGHPS